MGKQIKLFLQELKKCFILFISDPKPLAAGLIAPTAILFIFCLIFGNFSTLPIDIQNFDLGEYGNLLEEEIISSISPLGDIPYYENVNGTGKDAVAAVLIPENFSNDISSNRHPEIIFKLDNFNSDFAKNLRLYLQEGILSFYNKYYPEMDVKIIEILPESGQVEWVDIIATGSILLAAIISGMFLYLYLFFKEKEYGTILFYSIAPRSLLGSYFARIILCWLYSMIIVAINMLLAYALTGRSFFTLSGLIFPVLSFAALFYIAVSSIISLFTDKFYTAAMIMMMGSILGWFITGGMNSGIVDKTTITGVIASALPNIYCLNIIRNTAFGLELGNIKLDYTVLLIMGFGSIVIAYILYYLKLYRGRIFTH